MAVVVVGLNHRTVPLPVLERMTVLPALLPKALHALAGGDHLDELVVLSTCMRTEVYAEAGRFHGAVNEIRSFLTEWSDTPPDTFVDHLYSYYDDAAISHLFKVASGLDSTILGEGEILAQVRRSWEAARAESACGPVLEVLFRTAVEAGKKVRSETAIARGTTSLSQGAVALAADRLAPGSEPEDVLGESSVLVVGAGEVGEGVMRALGGIKGRGSLNVVNRTHAKAVELADRFDGVPLYWDELPRAMVSADVVITSSGASNLLFGADDISTVLELRHGRNLLIIDLAVPRDVDPGAATIDGVELLDMDDISRFVGSGMAERRKEVPRAEQILNDEIDRYLDVAAQRELAPLISALHARSEEVRLAELERLAGRLGPLDDRQRRAVEALTRGIVAKLLHTPTIEVKAAAGTRKGDELAQAFRQLFDL